MQLLNLEVIDRKKGALFIEAIEQRVKQEQQEPTNRTDVVHLLVEATKKGRHFRCSVNVALIRTVSDEKHNLSTPITSTEIIANAFIILFGGLDSVSTTLSFAAYELALNPVVQRKLREEIVQTSQKYKKFTVDVLQEMGYMDMVISG